MRSQASCEDLYAVTDLLGDGVGTLSSVVWPLARSHMLRNKPSKTHWVIEKSKKKKGTVGRGEEGAGVGRLTGLKRSKAHFIHVCACMGTSQ